MTNVVNAFDPEAVIFGGKIGLVASLIQGPLQEKVSQRSLARGGRQIPILFGALGAESPIIGAFALILRELFQNPEFHFSHSRGTTEGRPVDRP
jgi:predicted NBD/HSP70 family sugar kinase